MTPCLAEDEVVVDGGAGPVQLAQAGTLAAAEAGEEEKEADSWVVHITATSPPQQLIEN